MTLILRIGLENAVLGTVLALVVFAVTRCWRNPQAAHVLWLLVLAKFVMPPLVTLPLPGWLVADRDADVAESVPPTVVEAPATIELVTSTATRSSLDAPTDGLDLARSIRFEAANPPPIVARELSPEPALTAVSPTPALTAATFDWGPLVAAIWLAGSLVVFVSGVVRVRRFRQFVAETEPAGVETLRDVGDLSRRLGLRRPPAVRIVRGTIPPLVQSTATRPAILLPKALFERLDGVSRRTILAHELAHIHRRDHQVRWLEALVVVLYWWNPIVRLVRRELQAAEEECCDAWVGWLVPESGRQYAEAIVATVDFLACGRVALPATASGMSRAFPLKRRVAAILESSLPRRMTGPMRIAVATLALVVLPLSMSTRSEEPPLDAAQPSATGPERPDRTAAQITSTKDNALALQVPAEQPAAPSREPGIVIEGRCVDDDGAPLADAEVVLFFFERYGAQGARKGQGTTGPDGKFRFARQKPLAGSDAFLEHYVVAARKPGCSSIYRVLQATDLLPGGNNELSLKLSQKTGTLSGRVTNERGGPLAGADIFVMFPLPGFQQAVTDAEGRYAISDLPAWQPKPEFEGANGDIGSNTQIYFRVRHPDYPLTLASYTAIPQVVDVQLLPGMTIEGRVLDLVTGRPAAGARVSAQGVDRSASPGGGEAIADDRGEYRLRLPAGSYNIVAQKENRLGVALDSFAGPVGETTRAPDLKLISGGVIAGKVFDIDGNPLSRLRENQALRIGNHGPASPRSGARVAAALVQADGTYRLRVAPGENYPYLMADLDTERNPRTVLGLPPIVVGEGETVTLDFHVKVKALLRPEPAPPAAKRILHFPADRAVGILETRPVQPASYRTSLFDPDWQQAGEARGDVAVDRDADVKLHVSKAASTDLSFLSKLDSGDVQVLGLFRTDADDEGMRHVGRLTGLKALDLRDVRITDEGVRHLGALKGLHLLHFQIRQGPIGVPRGLDLLRIQEAFGAKERLVGISDAGLRALALARMPELQALFLTGCPVTDEGMEALALLKSLRFVDLGETRVWDTGLEQLAKLPQLTELRVGGGRDSRVGSRVSDAGLRHIGSLTRLRALSIRGERITNAGLRHLERLKELETLTIEETSINESGLALLEPLTSLSDLRFHGMGLRDAGARQLAKLKSLRRLDAQLDLTDDGVRALAGLPLLENLTLSGGVTDDGVTTIATMKSLKSLWLQHCPVTDAGLARLGSVPTLESLLLNSTRVTGESFESLAALPRLTALNWTVPSAATEDRPPTLRSIGKLSHLRRLSLSGGAFFASGLSHLADSQQLEQLEIAGVFVTDDDTKALAGLGSLKDLRISKSRLTDAGLSRLGQLKKLEYLSVAGNFTPKGLEALRGLTALGIVRLGSEHLSEEDLETLARAMPSVQEATRLPPPLHGGPWPPRAEAYRKLKTVREAVEVLKAHLTEDGKPEYAALLSEERVRKAIRTAVQSYEAGMAVKEPDRPGIKAYFEQMIKPVCLSAADDGTWGRECQFSYFFGLTTKTGVPYEGLGLRLLISTPDAKFQGFGLPVLDLFFGRFED